MLYEIEFFRHTTGNQIKIVRRHLGDFDNLDAAKAYGMANTGLKDSPAEVDGFDIRENGTLKSTVITRIPDRDDG